ncbi:hypothetical protein V6N13_011929 [Hibiscus sabdariffa]
MTWNRNLEPSSYGHHEGSFPIGSPNSVLQLLSQNCCLPLPELKNKIDTMRKVGSKMQHYCKRHLKLISTYKLCMHFVSIFHSHCKPGKETTDLVLYLFSENSVWKVGNVELRTHISVEA